MPSPDNLVPRGHPGHPGGPVAAIQGTRASLRTQLLRGEGRQGRSQGTLREATSRIIITAGTCSA